MSERFVLPTAIPLPLKQEVLNELVPKAKDWAIMHGAGMRPKTNFNPDGLNFAPFVLTPSAFPRKEFTRALQMQPILNELMHKVAHKPEFLKKCLEHTIKVDEFTKGLFQIYETVLAEGITQPISLGLFRSDLMLESTCGDSDDCTNQMPYCCWKQVEFNTIASGFGWLGPASGYLQRFILEELGHFKECENMPENNALQGICGAMLEAHQIYGKASAVILFVIEDVTYNICDQRFHEFELRKLNPHVKVIRKTLTEIYKYGKLGTKKELLIEGVEVAVIYFRAGYEPGQYHSKNEWDARLMMERSSAIKSPSIHYHLAGTKKVQQELSKPGVVELFFDDPVKCDLVRDIFTGLYSLDFDEHGEKGVQLALNSPEKCVLKPQREGGGNNIYGNDVKEAMLKMIDSQERCAWILMKRINPPILKGYMVRPGDSKLPEIVDMVSELGIFGAIIGNENTIMRNEQVGHMLRTKIATANEGGVAAGLGALDSPYLF